MNGIDIIIVLLVFILACLVTLISLAIWTDKDIAPEKQNIGLKIFRWGWKITLPLVVWLALSIKVPFDKTEILEQGSFPISCVKDGEGTIFQTCSFPTSYLGPSDTKDSRQQLINAVITKGGLSTTINVTKLTNRILPAQSRLKIIKYSNAALGIEYGPSIVAYFIEPNQCEVSP